MREENSTRRASIAGLWIAGLALVAAGAQAEPSRPAVDRINGELAGAYEYESASEATINTGTGTATFPRRRQDTAAFSARLTVPLGQRFGGRITTRGGPAWSSVAGLDKLAGSVTSLTELFWRNPDRGHLSAGYEFEWLDFPASGQATSHGAVADFAYYFPDLGTGPIDWRLRLGFARAHVNVPGTPSDDRSEIDLRSEPVWYLTDTFQISLPFGLTWNDVGSSASRAGPELAGEVATEWLIGPEQARFVALTIGGGYRRSITGNAPPTTDLRRNVWSFAVGVRVLSHPVESLVALARSRR